MEEQINLDMTRRKDGKLSHMRSYFGDPESDIMEHLEVTWSSIPFVSGIKDIYDSYLFFDMNSQAQYDIEETASAMIALVAKQIRNLRQKNRSELSNKDVAELLCASMIRLDIGERKGWIQDFCVSYCILPAISEDEDVWGTIYYRNGRPVCVRCDHLFAIYVVDDLIHLGIDAWGTATIPSAQLFDLESNSD